MFNIDYKYPIPYQRIEIENIPIDIPNFEDVTTALDLGIVKEVYVELNTTDEDYKEKLDFF